MQVVDLQLIASSTVGEVETAVFFRREQLCVLMLLKKSRQLNEFDRGKDSFEFFICIYTDMSPTEQTAIKSEKDQ